MYRCNLIFVCFHIGVFLFLFVFVFILLSCNSYSLQDWFNFLRYDSWDSTNKTFLALIGASHSSCHVSGVNAMVLVKGLCVRACCFYVTRHKALVSNCRRQKVGYWGGVTHLGLLGLCRGLRILYELVFHIPNHGILHLFCFRSWDPVLVQLKLFMSVDWWTSLEKKLRWICCVMWEKQKL